MSKNYYSLIFFLFSLYFVRYYANGQNIPKVRNLQIKKTKEKLKIDGLLNEKMWKEAEIASDFWQYFPFDTAIAYTRSEVKVSYDDEFMYFGFKVIDPVKGDYVTTSLRRDFRGSHNDVITVVLDPFMDQTNGILFGINPFGVQREALISGNSGGNRLSSSNIGFDLSWDNKWYSAAKIHDGYWTAEMAIPFKTLRYKEGGTTWRANFYRLDSKSGERSTWGHIPRNQTLLSLAFGGELHFNEPLPKPGANIAVIPYLSGGVSRDFQTEDERTVSTGDFGADAKIAVTPSLNLDLTINPDFSQVEVDVQQTNLTRFELFFPERRQFFLENADVFASFGDDRIRPFFSRRIGIALDSTTGQNVQNQINFGARLSGRIDKNWRMGLMTMQAAKDDGIGLPSYNYTVAALQRQVFTRSNISAIFINKQNFRDGNTDRFSLGSEDYNRVVGLDYNHASADNRWSGKVFYHQSFTPDEKNNEAFAHGASLTYNVPAVRLTWNHSIIGEEYNPEVGFVPRTGFKRISPGAAYTFYPNKAITSHGPGFETEFIWTNDLGKTDHNLNLYYQIDFSNTSRLEAGFQHQYTYLFEDFDPTRLNEGVPLPEGNDYNYLNFTGFYESDKRHAVYYEIQSQIGQFFEGSLISFSGTLNYRFKKYGLATLNFAYNRIEMPEPYASATILLLGPRFDITFTRNLFLTTFFQYNDQTDNININARLQYRFKPVSDFFLVYTDNYFASNLNVKSRAVVAKLTYWLNL
ncbi:MAG: DUF5916 domain-containing protein [Bacteroidota bacterium]